MLDNNTEKAKERWPLLLQRELTSGELELIEMTEGEIDLHLGYCPSIYTHGLSIPFSQSREKDLTND